MKPGKSMQTGDDLLKQVREEISVRVDAVSRGTPQTYDGYQNLVGQIQGLRTAEQLITTLLESTQDDDFGA